MKWPFAVMLATAALFGCRSTQPAANPFIRTTVPPPGTGQGAVVVQGEQYYPSGAAPGVAPGTAPPPLITSPPPPGAVPMGPPPGAMPPPGAAPPPVIPPRDKYGPPGGSFQYNQSSNERPATAAEDGVVLASAVESPADLAERWLSEERPAEKSDAVKQAVLLAVDQDPLVGDIDRGREGHVPPGPIASDARVEPPESLALDDQEPRVSSDAMRILHGRSPDSDVVDLDTLRATRMDVDNEAGTSEPRAVASAAAHATRPLAQPAAHQVAEATTEATAEPPTPGEEPIAAGDLALDDSDSDEDSPEGESSSRIEIRAERPNFDYARDYGALRGRLEYSQSSRQWKLRYIPIDGATDSYGGSVILPSSPALSAFKAGDLVAVRGSLAGQNAATRGFSPLYELESIEPLAQ
jgi:hypothetical protein